MRKTIQTNEDLLPKFITLQKHNILLSKTDYNLIHDKCMTYLQKYGLDSDYKVNYEGKLSEEIIDFLYEKHR